ncbi:maleylpyruvate isomerase family mycothiol-dependent enzyme [Rhodococcus gannanensis]|uniref:Maleylpyruvate isomerase family mycothiol-dependent enzyme n=1 Tax=Rhodococcus gannanensis TaxID=1960308 RepID=A0ABW4NX33_9NOCA
MDPVWQIVHTERVALVADLARITDEQWDTPSLCEGWTVHDVAAHLVANARTTRLGLVRDMVRARFDFHRQSEQGVARERGATPAQTLQRLREVAPLTATPPAPLDSRLVEEVVHGEDIRRPLGIEHTYLPEAVVRGLRYQARTSEAFGGAKQLIAGIRLRATDVDVTIGDGPEARGPALELLLAVSGRGKAVRDLSGPGAPHLHP